MRVTKEFCRMTTQNGIRYITREQTRQEEPTQLHPYLKNTVCGSCHKEILVGSLMRETVYGKRVHEECFIDLSEDESRERREINATT